MIKTTFAAFNESSEESLVVYHGTCRVLGDKILREGQINPRPDGNRYVYVTTDKAAARQYARAWTAWALTEYKKAFPKRKCPAEGTILTFSLPKHKLSEDPYNPEGEPNQWRWKGPLKFDDGNPRMGGAETLVSSEVVPFPDLKNETKCLMAYSYWIGIGRASDDDEDEYINPVSSLGGDMNKLNKKLDDEGL